MQNTYNIIIIIHLVYTVVNFKRHAYAFGHVGVHHSIISVKVNITTYPVCVLPITAHWLSYPW